MMVDLPIELKEAIIAEIEKLHFTIADDGRTDVYIVLGVNIIIGPNGCEMDGVFFPNTKDIGSALINARTVIYNRVAEDKVMKLREIFGVKEKT